MLELRLLNDDDVSLVEIWLNKAHVKRWYEIPRFDISISDWISEIKARNDKFKWITYLVVLWQGRPIGLCQYYKCVDSHEDFGMLPLEGAYGIDYLIGEEAYLGKGLGRQMVSSLADKLFSLPDVQRITADIDADNKASEMTLLSCGFQLLDTGHSRYVIYKGNNR